MNRKLMEMVCVVVVGNMLSLGNAYAGVLGEIVEQTGKAVVRTVTGEAVEAGAKSAAKQTLKRAVQEAGEAGAKRAAAKSAGLIDDVVSKGGVGDSVADFAWRNKGTLAGAAAVATMVANPETTLASGASMFNSSVDSAAKHVVGPAVTSSGGLFWGLFLVWMIAGIVAAICYGAMQRKNVGWCVRLLSNATIFVSQRIRRSRAQ